MEAFNIKGGGGAVVGHKKQNMTDKLLWIFNISQTLFGVVLGYVQCKKPNPHLINSPTCLEHKYYYPHRILRSLW